MRRAPVTVQSKMMLHLQLDQTQTRETGGVFDLSQLFAIRDRYHECRKEIITTVQPSLRYCVVQVKLRDGSKHEALCRELLGVIKKWLYENRVVYRELTAPLTVEGYVGELDLGWTYPAKPASLCLNRNHPL